MAFSQSNDSGFFGLIQRNGYEGIYVSDYFHRYNCTCNF